MKKIRRKSPQATAEAALRQPLLLGNERGVALVFALVIMVVLAIIGASATMTSRVDLKVSGNTKMVRQAFYLADGGIELSSKVIGKIIADRALPAFADTPALTYDGVIYDNPSSPTAYTTDSSQSVTLVDKVMGYQANDDSSNDKSDIVMNQGAQGSLAVDVTRVRTQYLAGGGTEFAAGAEGVGGAASTAVYYNFDSNASGGTGAAATRSEILAQYRKVSGVAGGR